MDHIVVVVIILNLLFPLKKGKMCIMENLEYAEQ